jgi:hypothetical protein
MSHEYTPSCPCDPCEDYRFENVLTMMDPFKRLRRDSDEEEE